MSTDVSVSPTSSPSLSEVLLANPSITAAVTKLLEPAAPLFQAMQAAEATVEPGEQSAAPAQEGVVDAEFTEVKKEGE